MELLIHATSLQNKHRVKRVGFLDVAVLQCPVAGGLITNICQMSLVQFHLIFVVLDFGGGGTGRRSSVVSLSVARLLLEISEKTGNQGQAPSLRSTVSSHLYLVMVLLCVGGGFHERPL